MTRRAGVPPGPPGEGRRADLITYLSLLAANLIWGGAYLVIAVALRFFTPLALTALRLAVSAGCVWAYARWRGEGLAVRRGDALPLLGVGCLLNTAFQLFLNASLAFTTPAHASLGVSTMPIFAALAARLVLRERLSARRGAAILMAFAGVVLVITSGRGLGGARNPLVGDLLALATAASWALGSVFSKPFLGRYTPLAFTVLSGIGGALSGIPWGVRDLFATSWGTIPVVGWLALLYVSVLAMGVGWLVWNRAIARIEVTQVAIFSNLTPVFALALSALLFGEPLTAPLLAGGALVVAGTYLTQRT